MAQEVFVLVDAMDSDAPVYQQTPEGRSQVRKMPLHRPTLRQTFQDKDGVGKTIRFKLNARSIDQSEQIEKEKIDANARFTTAERRALEFKNGILATTNGLAIQYLKAHPECEGFEGECEDIREPRYRVLNAQQESKIKNSEMRSRIKAASKVIDLDLVQAQEMLIRLNGSFFVTPNDVEECQNLLMQFVDDADEAGLELVLKEETTIDEDATVLIGKLINSKLLSFDAVQGKISKKGKNSQWKTIRELSDTYTLEERERLFSDFLNSEEGKPLKEDLQKDLKAFESKQ